MAALLWLVFAAIIVIWLVGLLADIAGGLIHLLLIVALAVLILNLLSGRRRAP
ncbi:MAG: lmo0937 family membrane protein [Dehalococcoidia bacterium]